MDFPAKHYTTNFKALCCILNIIVYPDADYQDFIDCRWHRHTARKGEVLTAKFFKRQVLASSSLLHSLLLDRRDNDTTSSLRNAKPFYSFRTRTNRFRKSFLSYWLDNYTHIPQWFDNVSINFQAQLRVYFLCFIPYLYILYFVFCMTV